MYKSFHVKNCFPDFNESRSFSTDLKNIYIQILNLMKICPVGAVFFHADGQTDRHDKANSLL
jgi:hypothetical protein